MRFHDSVSLSVSLLLARWAAGVMAGAAVFVLLTILPLHAADVPVVQGDQIIIGAKVSRPITPPPGAGFSNVSATSSNAQVIQIGSVDNSSGGGWSVDFTVTGVGIAAVTVTWSNPATNTARKQYFVVASGVRVERASRIFISRGDTTVVPEVQAINANAYVGNNLTPSTAIVAPQLTNVGVQLTGQSVGTSFVIIEMANGGTGPRRFEVVIVTVIEPGTVPVYE